LVDANRAISWGEGAEARLSVGPFERGEPIAAGAVGQVDRRHDLDALRAFAMLLGIGLHAALSFFPIPWMVQDTQQNPLFGLGTAAVHGFRMPLFFLISGFFTMMLYRKRGLVPLLRQRALRILVPCLLGLVTIGPLLHYVSEWAVRSAAAPGDLSQLSVADAVRQGDKRLVGVLLLGEHSAIDQPDAQFGVTPLGWAVLRGDADLVQMLLARGAQVNAGNRDGSTPLHSAAFVGRHDLATLLLTHGADAKIRNQSQSQAIESTTVDWAITSSLLGYLGLPQPDRAVAEQGRAKVRELLADVSAPLQPTAEARDATTRVATRSLRDRYQAFLNSSIWRIQIGTVSLHLMQSNVFDHLWFLWYLCWMVSIFAVTAITASRIDWPRSPRLPVLSVGRFAWLIPLTFVPQWFMGLAGPVFGADTSTGLIPPPHLLLYYLIFFGFGVLYFDAHDARGQLGRWWWLALPTGLFVAFPIGLFGIGGRVLSVTLQVVYAWAMIVGLMGLFRLVLRKENRTIRYLSDASYWLYLVHLPLIIYAQALVRTWNWSAWSKYLLISTVSLTILLVSYQLCVRYTWIGLLLNGRRTRSRRPRASEPNVPQPSVSEPA
jgi:peptidoglycan/LPS O-acetylase OafA/YrhL